MLVLIALPVVIGQIAAHSVRSLLVEAAASKEILQHSGVYIQMETFLVNQLSQGFEDSEIQFTATEINTVVRAVLPASRLQQLAETAVDGLHRWFWEGTARPEIVLDLTEARNALPGAIRPIIVAKVEALPVCSAAQAAQLALTYKGGMPPCKSPSADFNRMVVEKAIPDAELQKMMPGRVDVAAELEAANGPRYWQDLSQSIGEARLALDLIPYGWGAVLILLALLAVLNLDRWYTPFGWMAAPLLLGGGLLLLVGLVGTNVAIPFIRDAVGGEDPSGELALSVARVALQTLFVAMRNISMVVALGGLASVIVAVAGKVMSPPADDSGARVA